MLATLLAILLAAGNPALAIKSAREAIQKKEYASAVKMLQDAIPDANAIIDTNQRGMALAALHFYSALALSGMNDEQGSKAELDEFFQLNPQAAALDPAKYDAQFVRWFQAVRTLRNAEATANFDQLYPGFAQFTGKARVLAPSEWGESPDLTILGTAEEKDTWRRLQDDAARRAFVDDFWRHRDSNGFRTEFDRRVVFADETFSTPKTRGALSDRGRIFLIFGPPRTIRQQPLSQREGGSVRLAPAASAAPSSNERSATGGSFRAMQANEMNRGITSPDALVKGSVERWVYPQVVFKFITEEGYGDHVLQRDFNSLKALHDAVSPH